MKNILLIIVGIILLVLLGAAYDMYAGPQLVPVATQSKNETYATNHALEITPDFLFKTLEGKEFSISNLRGKPVILSFWATWCPTCVVDFPHMLDLVKSFDGKVTLVAVSSDYKLVDITKYIKKQNKEIREILNADYVYITLDLKRSITYDKFFTERYPETIIIDPNGKMVRKIVGEFDWNSEEIKQFLETIIKE